MKKFIFLLVTLSLSTTLFSQIPTDSLIGYWPFSSNADDKSGFGNHGTVSGAVLTSDRFGNPNNAYKFDGVNDYIDSDFNFSGAQTSFSVSYWFKLDPSYNYTKAKIFHFQESLTTYEVTNDFLTSKKLNFFISGSVNNPNGINFSNDTIAKDKWYHVITTFDFNSKVKQIYINGVLDTSAVSINIINRLPISKLRMGARIMNGPGGTLEYFKGIIDDFRIYKRVLKPNEVLNLYNECNYTVSISPSISYNNVGQTAQFTVQPTIPGATIQWLTDRDFGYQNVLNNAKYTGASSNTLEIKNVQLSNHLQAFKVVVIDGNCKDTSDVALISITDTCLFSVADTLIINTTLTGIPEPNNKNTIKIYPNPSKDHITIDFGNFVVMNGYSINIVNMSGATQYSSNINQQSVYLNLSGWSGKGMYLVQVIDNFGDVIDVKKIVIQ